MADVAIAYYRQWPHFAQLAARAHATMLGSSLSAWEEHPDPEVRQQFERAMAFEANLIAQGQRDGDLRSADPRALAHLLSVLVNTFLAVGTTGDAAADDGDNAGGLTGTELHGILDSVLRKGN